MFFFRGYLIRGVVFLCIYFSERQDKDCGCEGSDAEMIGNSRRDRDTEDEDEERQERSSEGGFGGFGGWRSHLLGGLTQRVKSWYWGARPLVSSSRTSAQIFFFFLIIPLLIIILFNFNFIFFGHGCVFFYILFSTVRPHAFQLIFIAISNYAIRFI